MGANSQPAEHGVVGAHGLAGVELTFDDQAKEMHERELILGVVDLAAEEGDPGAVFLGVVQELKGVARRAGRAAQDADDQVRVVSNELFHGLRAVIDHLQEQAAARPARRRRASARSCR